MNNFTAILDWDSNFFNKKIAKIVVNNLDEKYIEKKLSEYKAFKFDLVYIFLADKAVLSKDICSSYNCKWVDCKMIYGLCVEATCVTSPLVMEYEGVPSQLYELAFLSGINSRYRTDSNFQEDEFKRLYQTWVDNSVKHLIADKVFIFKEKENIDGFVTVKIHDGKSTIGLIATTPERQAQGIGSALISAVKKYVKDAEAPNLDVATQRENTLACSFYEKNGFSLKSETNIYHAWLK